MRLPDLVTPVSSPDGHDGQLGKDNGAANGRRHFLAALDAQADVAVLVTDGDERLETRPLTGARLLLHRHDLQHLKRNSNTRKIQKEMSKFGLMQELK